MQQAARTHGLCHIPVRHTPGATLCISWLPHAHVGTASSLQPLPEGPQRTALVLVPAPRFNGPLDEILDSKSLRETCCCC